MIYTDRRAAIEKLINDRNYEMLIGVWKDDGRLIAGLFNLIERMADSGKP